MTQFTQGTRVMSGITGVKVFSATMLAQRSELGETVTKWIAARPELEILDMVVKQSSDSRFHCLSITLFYRDKK